MLSQVQKNRFLKYKFTKLLPLQQNHSDESPSSKTMSKSGQVTCRFLGPQPQCSEASVDLENEPIFQKGIFHSLIFESIVGLQTFFSIVQNYHRPMPSLMPTHSLAPEASFPPSPVIDHSSDLPCPIFTSCTVTPIHATLST